MYFSLWICWFYLQARWRRVCCSDWRRDPWVCSRTARRRPCCRRSARTSSPRRRSWKSSTRLRIITNQSEWRGDEYLEAWSECLRLKNKVMQKIKIWEFGEGHHTQNSILFQTLCKSRILVRGFRSILGSKQPGPLGQNSNILTLRHPQKNPRFMPERLFGQNNKFWVSPDTCWPWGLNSLIVAPKWSASETCGILRKFVESGAPRTRPHTRSVNGRPGPRRVWILGWWLSA